MIRLDRRSYARLARMREELTRRAREGKEMGGADLELTLAAVLRMLLSRSLDHFEKAFKLPEIPEDGEEE
jgi:hypothetical protein